MRPRMIIYGVLLCSAFHLTADPMNANIALIRKVWYMRHNACQKSTSQSTRYTITCTHLENIMQHLIDTA